MVNYKELKEKTDPSIKTLLSITKLEDKKEMKINDNYNCESC